jgi:hypothetical protein
MPGLFINGFSGLPLEAVILWLAITWAAVIIYETICTLLHRFGHRPGTPPGINVNWAGKRDCGSNLGIYDLRLAMPQAENTADDGQRAEHAHDDRGEEHGSSGGVIAFMRCEQDD